MHKYFDAAPVYWVLFRCDTDHEEKYSPIILLDRGETPSQVALTDGIFFLSHDFASALPVLWYALHLPRNVFDLVESPPRRLRSVFGIDACHHVLLLPHNAPRAVFDRLPQPSLILASSEVADEAVKLGADFGCAVLREDQAMPESLAGAWADIGHRFQPTGTTPWLSPPKWVESGADAGMVLTTAFVLRQLGSPEFIETLGPVGTLSLHARAWSTVLECADERQEEPAKVSDEFQQRVDVELRRVRLPVTVAVPAMSPQHARLVGLAGRKVSAAEERALDFLVTHHALRSNGVAFRTEPAVANVFDGLHRLENAMTARHISGRRVQHLLKTLGGTFAGLLGDGEAVVSRASRLTFFSPLPMGLALLPGDTAPLSCRGPVAYVPVVPLNRCIQLETTFKPPIVLEPLRVLIADGIGQGDEQRYVRAVAESAWEVVQEAVRLVAGWECSIVRVDSEKRLSAELEEHQPNVLWINAHGSWLRDQNAAGILLENEFTLLDDIYPAPPIVILSSCETAPRAASPVSVVDILLRSRARAVIGTMVPVRARHNVTLMARLFNELVDNTRARRFDTFADVWSHITTSNAYHDITMASEQVLEWSLAGDERRPEVRFKNELSAGRLRGHHIYQDSLAVLAEIADGVGFGGTFRATMANPGYVPETLFYAVYGWPETVLLRPPMAPTVEFGETEGRRLGARSDDGNV